MKEFISYSFNFTEMGKFLSSLFWRKGLLFNSHFSLKFVYFMFFQFWRKGILFITHIAFEWAYLLFFLFWKYRFISYTIMFLIKISKCIFLSLFSIKIVFNLCLKLQILVFYILNLYQYHFEILLLKESNGSSPKLAPLLIS